MSSAGPPSPQLPMNRDPGPPISRARIGLLINPTAGIGGTVALKGSDGAGTVERALTLGAVPRAGERAIVAMSKLRDRWPRSLPWPEVHAGSGPMGEFVARACDMEPRVYGSVGALGETTRDDTRRIAMGMLETGLDLLLVVGGDGTVRDVCAAVGTRIPVLGIPAGVKIHSPVYATSPAAAGDLAASFLGTYPAHRRTEFAEVVDLDEDAYRAGEIAPRLFGELRVPAGDPRMQARKEPSPATHQRAGAEAAEGIVRRLPPGIRCILGPGSTVRAVGARLGVAKTLIGVDVVDVAADGHPQGTTLIGLDVGARELERLVANRRAILVVTPIGGQGFILGRGNQQLSPRVLRSVLDTVGRRGIVVVATAAKLASLGGSPLLVDSGDAAIDGELSGYLDVITGPSACTPYRVRPA